MKKTVIRMGFVAAVVATATVGVGTTAHAAVPTGPQLTKQWCC